MRILPMGARAVLVEDLGVDPAAWSLGVRAAAIDGVVDVVPAARTVLISWDRADRLDEVVERLEQVLPSPDPPGRDDAVVIPTIYDGPDLDDVASATGRSVDDVVRLHSDAIYRVAFCGFAPGFGYLSGLPDELRLPRRPTPRERVAAGSVAIAAEYSAVYPTSSPGGWHLLGRTERPMFDVHADPPALLQPGRTVRFEPT